MEHDAFAVRSDRLVEVLGVDPRLQEGLSAGAQVQPGILRMTGAPGCQVFVDWSGWKQVKIHLPRTTGTAAEVTLIFRLWFTTGEVPSGDDLEKQLLYLGANLYRILADHLSDPLWELLTFAAAPVGVRAQGSSAVWRCGYIDTTLQYREVTP